MKMKTLTHLIIAKRSLVQPAKYLRAPLYAVQGQADNQDKNWVRVEVPKCVTKRPINKLSLS